MVRGVVPEEHVKDVPRKPQPAVVVDAFDGGEGEEEDGRSCGHPREEESQGSAEGVQYEAFERVVVLATEGVGHNEAVVPRVDMAVQELVHVHVSVPEVLPGVNHEHTDEELPHNDERWSVCIWARRVIVRSAYLHIYIEFSYTSS